MSSQLEVCRPYVPHAIHHCPHPAIHPRAGPIPDCYAVPSSHKRIRLAAKALTTIDTEHPAEANIREQYSAQTLNGSFPPLQPITQDPQEEPQPRPASVPPERAKRGRKKKNPKPEIQDGFFVHETVAFPEHQPWLKTRPRQRKAGPAEVIEKVAAAPIPASVAPNAGEALSLNKHADRIAALIAQKRQENEATLYRRRMAIQQRVHRGEKDDEEQIIAASHDELKRKMELSAKGIFEERPPEGRDLELAQKSLTKPSEEQNNDSVDRRSSVGSPGPEIYSQPGEELRLVQRPELEPQSEGYSGYAEDSDVDEEVARPEPNYNAKMPHLALVHPPPPHSGAAAAALQYNHTAYYQTTVTTQMLSVSNEYPVIQPPVQSYIQPGYATQHYAPVPLWNGMQAQMMQPWATQMWHALPTNRTPVLERLDLAQAQAEVYPTPEPNHQHPYQNHAVAQDNTSFLPLQHYSNSDTGVPHTVGYSDSHTTLHHSDCSPDNDNSSPPNNASTQSSTPTNPASHHCDQQPLVVKSNVNMFTRQARENGVIGGNNNFGAPPLQRRNMFDSRP